MAATDFVTEAQIDSLVTTSATAVKAANTAHAAHLADTSDAHDASAISVLDSGNKYTATDVEAALAEVKTLADAAATAANLTAHLNDTSDAHDASAISVLDAGGDLTATNVEDALAEIWAIADAAGGGGAVINDAATNTTEVWSSQKTQDEITEGITAVIDAAPGTLDTLNELAAALGDDPNFATTITTALGKRVRVDAAQSFTGGEKTQGQANLGLVPSTVDFAANFTAGLA